MRLKSLSLPVGILLTAVAVQAQQPPVEETLNVKRTSVDFVVTNAKGEPVHGLTESQFQILENSKPQPITNFSEITQPADPKEPASVPRYIAVFFDNYSLSPGNRTRLIAAVRAMVKETIRPGDQLSVVSWNRRFLSRTPFSADMAQLDAALNSISHEVGSSIDSERRQAERQIDDISTQAAFAQSLGKNAPDTYSSGLSAARHYADTRTRDVKSSINAIGSYLSSMSGLNGKKVLILAGESLPLRPGAEIFQRLEVARSRMTNSQAGAPNLESGQYDLSRDVTSLGEAANTAGVTVYAVNPNGTTRSRSGTVENSGSSDSTADFAVITSGIDGYQLLANTTGGRALIGENPEKLLGEIERDLQSYYSAAYRSSTQDASARTIEVRSTVPGNRVRYARNVTVHTLADDISRRVMANQLSDPSSNDLGITLKAQPIVALEGGKRKVPLVVMIPIAKLLLQPDGTQLKGGFSVYFCSADKNGEISSVSSQRHDIAWPKEALAEVQGKSIGYLIEIVQDKPRDNISVGVIDQNSQTTGFAKLSIEPVPSGS